MLEKRPKNAIICECQNIRMTKFWSQDEWLLSNTDEKLKTTEVQKPQNQCKDPWQRRECGATRNTEDKL